ncbi:hypothetical protein [Phnomibacter sp. MR]|uniref:hypothetical protein n=1 Tax=Phnomibacter sp. MR TaxID=3042318 RepID=UPI003A8112F6
MEFSIDDAKASLIHLYASEQYSDAYDLFHSYESFILNGNTTTRGYWLAVLLYNNKFERFIEAANLIRLQADNKQERIGILVDIYILAKIIYAHHVFINKPNLTNISEQLNYIESLAEEAEVLLMLHANKNVSIITLQNVLAKVKQLKQFSEDGPEYVDYLFACENQGYHVTKLSLKPLLKIQLFCLKRLFATYENDEAKKSLLTNETYKFLTRNTHLSYTINEFGIITYWQLKDYQEKKPILDFYIANCTERIEFHSGNSFWIDMLCSFTGRFFYDEKTQENIYQKVIKSFTQDDLLINEIREDHYFNHNSILLNLKCAFLIFDLSTIASEVSRLENSFIVSNRQLRQELSAFLQPFTVRLFWLYNYFLWKAETQMICITAKLLELIDNNEIKSYNGIKYNYLFYSTVEALIPIDISTTKEQYQKIIFRYTKTAEPLHLKSIIYFGKYEGYNIQELIVIDKDYLLWCIKEIESFYLSSNAFFELCIEYPSVIHNKNILIKNTLMNVWYYYRDEEDDYYEEDEGEIDWGEISEEEMRSMNRDADGWLEWNID